MRLIQTLIAASVLATSASAASSPPLDGFIAFQDPYLCHPRRHFNELLNDIIRWEELKDPSSSNDLYKGSLASLHIPAKYRKHVGKPHLVVEGDEYRATLPLHGTWHGLPINSLVVVNWAESESGFYLMFDATQDEVLRAANKAGFRIPANGSEYRDGEVLGVNVGVDTIGGKGTLYCVTG